MTSTIVATAPIVGTVAHGYRTEEMAQQPVVNQGALPLDILEEQVNRYIDTRKAINAPSP